MFFFVCFNLTFFIFVACIFTLVGCGIREISEHIHLDEELQLCLQNLHRHLQFRVWKLGVVSEQFLHLQSVKIICTENLELSKVQALLFGVGMQSSGVALLSHRRFQPRYC